MEAINYYLEAMNDLTFEDPNTTFLNLIRSLGDFSNANKWLQKAQSNVKELIPEKFHTQYKVFETIMGINYFLSINDGMLIVYYTNLFASLYETNNLYKQANAMYKLALQKRNEQAIRREWGLNNLNGGNGG